MKIAADAYYEISEKLFWHYVSFARSIFRELCLDEVYFAHACYYLSNDDEGSKKSGELIRLLQKEFSRERLAHALKRAGNLKRHVRESPEFSKELTEEVAEKQKRKIIKGEIRSIEERLQE